jgi:hypothetical protein
MIKFIKKILLFIIRKINKINYKKKFIFIHIPRSGGTSIKKFIFLNFGKEKVLENNDMNLIDYRYLNKNDKYNFFVGHKQIINTENTNNVNYFTVLRNPVDRVVSYYFYLKNFEKIKGEKKQLDNFVIDQNMNFDQYIEYTEEKFWDNLIVRFFSGKIIPLINPGRMKNFIGQYDVNDLKIDEKDFTLAKNNLKKVKIFFTKNTNKKNLSEYFSTKISLPFKIYNYSKIDYEIKDYQIKKIKDLNQLDFKIFDYFNN